MGTSRDGAVPVRAAGPRRDGRRSVGQRRGGLRSAASRRRVEPDDRGALATSSHRADLPDTFFLLARLKATLCAAVDDSLRAEHGISLETFDALTLISERAEGCDESTVAPALALSPDRARALISSLLSGRYASRRKRPDRAEPRLVRLTLRGTLLLTLASRTVDRELNRRIGSVLSPLDIAELSDALATIRQRSVRAEERIPPTPASSRLA
jgi:DNA-binding MarR family transcriptional regulator